MPAATQQALRTLEWIDRHEVLCVAARPAPARATASRRSGTWRSTRAAPCGHTPETLAQLLRRHRVDDSINKAISKLIRVDLVVVDDVGLLPI